MGALAAVDCFSSLLEEERTAALGADVGRLELLQDEKARVLAEMANDPPPLERQAELAARARGNVVLLRQLAELHRALLLEDGAPPVTYGRSGARASDGRSLRRR